MEHICAKQFLLTRLHSVTDTDLASFLVMIIIVTKRMVFSIKGL